ncbi:rhodanese-like domain-containing protein [Candidatus Gracilibacteria bacterium]|nr:rhodanese-like domain-containing protein [Candidatus Gracilibacteria bacterium]
MNIFDLFSPDTCNPLGRNNGCESWDKQTFLKKKEELGDKIVLVDMINHPIEGQETVPISNEMFESGEYPDGTIFVLYCHSGGSSGYVQKQLASKYPQYEFVNLAGGVGLWQYG